jgi:hypothetical protein
MTYDKSVFVNCPLDVEYNQLLKSILFSVLFMGLEPRIAIERFDSTEVRISKILELIRESKFGIHDLSRIKSGKKGEYFRLNMPFELGLDIGCKVFGNCEHKDKKCLVLEKEKYRYQAALSDLAGSDIRAHHDSVETLCKEIRNWLTDVAKIKNPPSPSAVWNAWIDFNAWLYDKLTQQGYSKKDIEELPTNEIVNHMKEWIPGLTTRSSLPTLPTRSQHPAAVGSASFGH